MCGLFEQTSSNSVSSSSLISDFFWWVRKALPRRHEPVHVHVVDSCCLSSWVWVSVAWNSWVQVLAAQTNLLQVSGARKRHTNVRLTFGDRNDRNQTCDLIDRLTPRPSRKLYANLCNLHNFPIARSEAFIWPNGTGTLGTIPLAWLVTMQHSQQPTDRPTAKPADRPTSRTTPWRQRWPTNAIMKHLSWGNSTFTDKALCKA